MDSNHYHHWYKIQKTFFLTSTSLDDFGPPPSSHLSIMKHHPNCGFKPLNQYQEEAVKDALGKPFTLVQGPPGKLSSSSIFQFVSKIYFVASLMLKIISLSPSSSSLITLVGAWGLHAVWPALYVLCNRFGYLRALPPSFVLLFLYRASASIFLSSSCPPTFRSPS